MEEIQRFVHTSIKADQEQDVEYNGSKVNVSATSVLNLPDPIPRPDSCFQ